MYNFQCLTKMDKQKRKKKKQGARYYMQFTVYIIIKKIVYREKSSSCV